MLVLDLTSLPFLKQHPLTPSLPQFYIEKSQG